MPIPTLYVFAISHYCEKARWALDHFGIEYELRHLMPGMNRGVAKKLGAEGGSLPFLRTDERPAMGSSAIIDWGEVNRRAGSDGLSGAGSGAVWAMEERLNDVTGVHVRRYYYSDALFADPASVRPMFSRDLPLVQKALVTIGWSKIVSKMITVMDLGAAQGVISRDILLSELDWLDGLLADGRPYLCGDQFSRADITAASLLAPLVNPPQHPTYANLALPKALAQTISNWQGRPILKWVTQLYAERR